MRLFTLLTSLLLHNAAWSVEFSLTQRQPRWGNSYSSAQLISPSFLTNFRIGLSSGLGNDRLARRTSYSFVAQFPLVDGISTDLVFLHQDWFFISTGRDTIAWRFHFLAPEENQPGLFGTIGMYTRWQKQRWNSNPHAPLMFNTDDKENFLALQMGWNFPQSQGGYYRFSAANFDDFNFLGPDHWNFELTYSFLTADKTKFDVDLGGQVSGFSGVTGYFNELHGRLGVSF